MVEPPSDGAPLYATLAVELNSITAILNPIVDRVRSMDQIYPLDLNRSGLSDPYQRVWESFLDYFLSALRIRSGVDPESEFDSYSECSFSEYIYAYDLSHLDVREQDNRYMTSLTEITDLFNQIIHGFLLDKIIPIEQDLMAQGYVITALTGQFFPGINRLLFDIFLRRNYVL